MQQLSLGLRSIALGALLLLIALGSGPVAVVSPIVATTPLWNLLIALVFLKGREEINARTIAGTVAVVIGTIAFFVCYLFVTFCA